MGGWQFWLCILFVTGAVVPPAWSQQGFLSLSCGGTTAYTDASNISWTPDTSYVTSGNTTNVIFVDGATSSDVPLRFFPESQLRHCFRLPVQNTSLVLIRPQFHYKNYDGLNSAPSFEVSVGTTLFATINLTNSDPWLEEIIWPVTKDTVIFCLHPIPNGGFPVISSLEIRPMPKEAYGGNWRNPPFNSLRKRFRINCGINSGFLRYPLDAFDRIWDRDQNFSPIQLSAGFSTQMPLNFSYVPESPPIGVLQSARVLARRNVLSYNFPLGEIGNYYIVLYFAGVFPVSSSFNILVNGELLRSNYTVKSAEVSLLSFTKKSVMFLNITLQKVSFYPHINAIEVYEIVEIPSEASSTTVSALQVIQQSMGLELGWQDDPCSPTPWAHIGCEGSLVTSLVLSDVSLKTISPTIGDLLDLKTLDLHNTSLSGGIQNLDSLQQLENLNLSFNQMTSFGSDLRALVSLQVLDMRNNSLQGTVPDTLGSLKNLHLLNLENNNLQGPLPRSLKKENLEIRTFGNLCLTFSTSTCYDNLDHPSIETPHFTVVDVKKQGRHKKSVLVGAIVGAACAIILVSFLVIIHQKKKKKKHENESSFASCPELGVRNWNSAKVFSYKEIKAATNNFKDTLGKGSFGSVYLGKLSNGKLVAVKVRFDRTQLGADSFINEVHLLSQVHHQNLVTLEGFCYEAKQQILVYEYLPGGSIADSLYGTKSKKVALNWVRRLKIAVDAAKGIDYLHNGSTPRIIHRDVKCSNILLDMEMNAKVSDFGLSKQVIHADASHVTTVVKGTAGYLDPEYYSTQQLTEKSDIYSFGVVLLELICGREPLSHAGSPDSFNLVLWAKPYLQAGAFEIVDDSLKETFSVESMRKVASIASRSVERDASQRPTMAEVLAELKDAYSIQLEYLAARAEHTN